MASFSLRDSFNGAIANLVDGLADPARRRRAALGFALCYAALWFVYAVIAKSSQDMNADMAEMVVWTRELALGYPKHPPLLAYILWVWFSFFPLADWAYFLLSVVTLSAGIWLAVELSAEWLEREKLAAVPFLLAIIPFYNFLGLKWDQNSILIPLWALAMWAMLRAFATRHDGWAALAGLAAAAAMLSKYWSVFLVAALALAALAHAGRRDYFRSRAPWVTALVFLAALAPHAYWLVRENFPPITWVATRRIAASSGEAMQSLAEYLAGTFGYAIIAILLVLAFVRPSPRALLDGFAPRDERRTAGILFWVPILLPTVPALIKNIRLLSLWNTPALNLLPVMLLGSPLVTVPRVAVLRIASIVTALTFLFVAVSPIVGYVILKRGVENNAAYARLVMQAAEREWRATPKAAGKPLRMVAGPFVLVSSAAIYGSDRPSTFADYSRYLSPWATDDRIAREGMVVMCEPGDPVCEHVINLYGGAFPGGHRSEVTLSRRWLWFENTPKRFVIATIPPRT